MKAYLIVGGMNADVAESRAYALAQERGLGGVNIVNVRRLTPALNDVCDEIAGGADAHFERDDVAGVCLLERGCPSRQALIELGRSWAVEFAERAV